MSSTITLTTDFGFGSPYVAAMKGVILGINPAVQIIDVAHNIGPQNIRQAAIVLAEATPWFPPGSIHVAVVDPGVGTRRRIVYAEIGGQRYLAPDNGLLSLLAKRQLPTAVFELTNAELWLSRVSATFHGRDIFRLSLGLDSTELGRQIDDLQSLDWPEARVSANRIDGAVQWVDRFGNLISNIRRESLPNSVQSSRLRIWCADREIQGIVRTYGDAAVKNVIALVGSSGFVEIAVVNGSAAKLLRVSAGELISIEW